MNFFFDNMMSPVLARMMAAFTDGVHKIIHIRDHEDFKHDTRDEVWIPSLARDVEQQWNVVSGDINLFQNPTIIAELHKSKLVFFCMDENWCSGNNENSQVWKLLKL